jgi:hypothetical protein
MKAAIFDTRLSQEWIGFTILRRVTIAVVAMQLSIGVVSGYRAIVQVYDVAIHVASPEVRPGSPITARVVTSGRTYVDARVELLQAGRADTLGTLRISANKASFYDPRPQHAALTVTIPPDVFSRFRRGKASIRAVAEGHSQFLRVPPPKISETAIFLVSSGVRSKAATLSN